MRRLVACALVGVVAAACGSVKEQPHDGGGDDIDAPIVPADFTLSATPTTLDAPILGTAAVTVSIERTGDAGEVSLTASGSTTITAAPATIAADMTSTELTFTLGAGTAAGPATLTISGSDGTHTHDVTVTITAKPIAMVTGKVRGDRANIFVGIVGQQPTASGADGSFTFTDVTPPYDLYTYVPATTSSDESEPAQVYYYRGLTTATPFVTAGATASTFFFISFARSATASGTFTGAGASAVKKLVAWSSGGDAVDPAATYAVTATWRSVTPTGAQSITGTMYGLSWTTRGTGAPDQVYFGTTGATLSSGGSSGGINLALEPIAATQLVGTVSSPAGFSSPTLTLSTLLHSNVSTPYDLWTGSTTDAAASIPTIDGAKFHLKASASSAGGTTTTLFPDLATTADVTTTLPTPAVLVTPTASATGVTTATPFHFTAPATGQVYVVSVVSPNVVYYVITEDDTVTIPDVAELPLPGATPFTWKVEGYAPASTVDDAALEAEPEGIVDFDFDGAAHSYTTSATRSFTSQ